MRQIVCVVFSNDIRTPGTPSIGMGKGDGHADYDFSLVSKVKCAKFHQDQNVGHHRILQLVQFFFISKTTASTFPTTCESYIAIGWMVCAPVGKGGSHSDRDFSLVSKVKCVNFHQDRNVGQHRILQLVQFFFISKITARTFPTSCESLIAIGWTLCAPDSSKNVFFISKTTASMFTTFESYIAIAWTVYVPVRQHRVLQLVQFFNF